MTVKQKTAMVLAAGFGERLGPLTDTCPKPLLPIRGVPLLHILLRLLKREGFGKVVINLHHLGHMIKESVGDGSSFGLEVHYSEEERILGTGGGIKAARHLLGDDTFLVINGDVMVDAPLGEIWEHHIEKNAAATLVVKDDPTSPGWGAIKVDEKGRVRQILGKPPCKDPLLPKLFVGIHVIEPVIFDFIPPGEKSSSTQDVYPAMLDSGLPVHYFEYTGPFIDIGTPERYRALQRAGIVIIPDRK